VRGIIIYCLANGTVLHEYMLLLCTVSGCDPSVLSVSLSIIYPLVLFLCHAIQSLDIAIRHQYNSVNYLSPRNFKYLLYFERLSVKQVNWGRLSLDFSLAFAGVVSH